MQSTSWNTGNTSIPLSSTTSTQKFDADSGEDSTASGVRVLHGSPSAAVIGQHSSSIEQAKQGLQHARKSVSDSLPEGAAEKGWANPRNNINSSPRPSSSMQSASAAQQEISDTTQKLVAYKEQFKKSTFEGVPLGKPAIVLMKKDLEAILRKDAVIKQAPIVLRAIGMLDKHIETGSLPWVSSLNLIDDILAALGHASPASHSVREPLYRKLASHGNSLLKEGDIETARQQFSLDALMRMKPAPPLITIASDSANPVADEYLERHADFFLKHADKLMLVFDNMPPNVLPDTVRNNTALPKAIRNLAGTVEIIGADTTKKSQLIFKYMEFERNLTLLNGSSNVVKRENLCKKLARELGRDANEINAPELMKKLQSANLFERTHPGELANQLSNAVRISLQKNTRKDAGNNDDLHLNQAKFLADISRNAGREGKTVVFITTAGKLLDHSVVFKNPDQSVQKTILISAGMKRHLGNEFEKCKLAPPLSLVFQDSKQKEFAYGAIDGKKEVDAYGSIPTTTNDCLVVPSILFNDAAAKRDLKPEFPFIGYRGAPDQVKKNFEAEFEGFFYGNKLNRTENHAKSGRAVPRFGEFLGLYVKRGSDKKQLLLEMKQDTNVMDFVNLWKDLLGAQGGGKASLANELKLHPRFDAINELVRLLS